MANRFLNNIRINDEYTFPVNDGSAGQAIVTDGSGNLSFGSAVASSADSTESVHISVKNTSGSQILKGTPVYVTGETGNSGKIEIAPADASDSAKMPALGILESTLSNNAEGFCVQGGLLEGLATATIDGTSTTANDTVYVKAGGGLTMTKPTGSNLIQNIAKVARVHASNGSLVVSSILRTNDVPNLSTGKIWVGDGNTIESSVVFLDEPNGRMGIGTTIPTYKLQVAGKSYLSGGIQMNSGDEIDFGNGNQYITGVNDTSLTLATGGSATLTATHTGNVGIGVTGPQEKLHVLNIGTARIEIEGTTGPAAFKATNNQGSYGWYVPSDSNSFRLWNFGTSADLVTVSSTGQLGIGTATPSQKLHVDGSARVTGAYYDSSNSAGTSGQVLSSTGSATSWVGGSGLPGGPYLPLAGGTMTGSLKLNDDVQLQVGSSADLQILHNPSDSFLVNNTGDLYLRNLADDKDIIFQSDDGSGGLATYMYLDGSGTRTIFQKDTRHDDTIQATFGTDSDLRIYHSGNNYIRQGSGTGDLIIEQAVDDKDIIFKSDNGSGGTAEYFRLDGSLADGTWKYTKFPDNSVIALGDATYGDLQLFHDDNQDNSYISNYTGDLIITNYADDKDIIFKSDDGSGGVETYFELQGVSGGGSPFTVFPDLSNLVFGSGHDFRFYHTGSTSFIENYTGDIQITNYSDDRDIIFKSDDGSGGTAVYFKLDGSLVNGTTTLGAVNFPDKSKLFFGTGSDLQIFHDGSDSFVTNTTGHFYIQNTSDNKIIELQSDNGSGGVAPYFRANGNTGEAILYHYGSEKIATTSDGIQVTGEIRTTDYIVHTGDSDTYFGFPTDNEFKFVVGGNNIIAGDINSAYLYYQGGAKLQTTSSGVTVTGTATATTFSGDLNGTINTATTAVTKPNATNDTTVATTAFVQNLIGTIPAGLVFQGTWNAATNTPTLASGSGTTGHFYIVSTDGSTNLDGITDWKVGDWAVFVEQGATDAWEKVDNSSVLDGSGTGQKVTMWSGSGTSNTLTNAPITVSGNNTTFAGTTTATSGIFSDVATLETKLNGNDSALNFTTASGDVFRIGLKDSDNTFRISKSDTSLATNTYLTIDSSGNATFAGNVRLPNGGKLYTWTDHDLNYLKYDIWRATASAGMTIENISSEGEIYLKSGNALALTLDDSQNATFAGTIDSKAITALAKGAQLGTSGYYINSTFKDTGDNVGVFLAHNDTANGTGAIAGINQLAFLTYGSAWTQALLLDSNQNATFAGNVGIGATNPLVPLHLENAADILAIFSSTDNKAVITIKDDDTTGYISAENARMSFGANTGANANNFNIDLSTNNVGIGTTSPTQKLDVDGAIITEDYRAASVFYLTSGGDWRFRTDTGIERVRITSAGNVGIGETLPDKKLEVSGDIKISGGDYNGLYFENAGGTTKSLLYQHASYDALVIKDVVNNADRFTFTNSGNFGIGTTSPGEKFEISGTGELSAKINNTQYSRSFTITQGGGYSHLKTSHSSGVAINYGQGNAGILSLFDNTTQAVKINANGASYFNGGNVGIGTTNPGAKLEISSTDNVAAIINSTSAFTFLDFENDGANRVQVGNASDGDFIIRTSDAERLRVDSNGNVGIGTANPSAKLHVVDTGSTSVTHYLKFNNEDSAYGGLTIGSTGADLKIRQNAGYGYFDATGFSFNYDTGRVWMNNGSILDVRNSSNSTVFYIPTSGNVGIGTTSPAQKLQVHGGNINIQNGDGAFLTFNNGDANIVVNYNGSGRDLSFKTYNGTALAEKMRIDKDGNVGIGTPSPNEKLHTAGNIHAYDASGINAALFASTAAGSTTIAIRSSGITHFNGGNVGIGATNPAEKLEVSGSIKSGNLKIEPSNGGRIGLNRNTSTGAIYNNSYGAFQLQNNGTGFFELQSYNSSGVYTGVLSMLESNGNVGIGTTSPGYKLDVAGTSRSDLHIFRSNQSAPTADAFIFRPADNTVALGTANAERVRVDSSGNVGIGTTNPYGRLNVIPSSNPTSPTAANQITVGESSSNSWYNLRLGYFLEGGAYKGSIQAIAGNTPNTLVLNGDGGNVGIGTTSPGAKLQIGSATYAPNANLGNNLLQIKSPSGFAYLTIGNGDSANSTSYIGGASGFTVIGSVTDAGVLSEHMRITNAGKVGIGTTSPTAKLQVSGVTGTSIIQALGADSNGFADLEVKSTGTTGASRLFFSDTAAKSGYIRYSHSGDSMEFATDNAEKMRIDSSGNVMIGNTSAAAKLDIRQDSGVAIRCEDGTGGYFVVNQGGDTGIGTTNPSSANGFDAKLQLESANPMLVYKETDQSTKWEVGAWGGNYVVYNGTNERMRIDSSGNVGIGVTSLSAKLDVTSATHAAHFTSTGDQVPVRIISGQVSNVSTIGFQGANSTNSYNVRVGAHTNDFVAFTANTERLRIDSSGDVTIGVGTNYGNKLTIYDDLSSGSRPFVIRHTTGDDLFSIYLNQSTGETRLEAAFDGSTDHFTFYTQGAERVRIDSDGNVGIGTNSPGSELEVDGETTTTNLSYPYPTATNQFHGEIVTFGTFVTGINNGDIQQGDIIVYTTAGTNTGWFRAQGNTTYGKKMLGIAMGSSPSDGILIKGFARDTHFSTTGDGDVLYLSASSAGDAADSPPGSTNNIVRIIGYMIDDSTDTIFFDPDKSWVQVS